MLLVYNKFLGESVPVAKVALPDSHDEIFDPKTHSRHLLFCGTNLIQSRASLDGPPRAVVLRTGKVFNFLIDKYFKYEL